MDYPKEHSTSLYDYSDKSVQHASYAAFTYAGISLFGAILALIQHFIYHSPATGGFISHQFASQQYLQHTPLVTAVIIALSVVIAVLSAVLGFFILRHSRAAAVAMLALVIVLQLFTWFVAHSGAGTLLSIIIVGFLLRGTRRIFQDHAERQLDATKEV